MGARWVHFDEPSCERNGARATLLMGYVFCLLGFVAMLLLWKDGIPYWKVFLGYALMGIGVGLAGTPASHSLTGSVPVLRAGMASGTADLQRDLGGAVMQSIFGALLTAGYASAASSQIAASNQSVSDNVAGQLTKSFDGAEAIAQEYPQYADQITAGAKTSFLQGDQWAYLAGIVAVLLGAVIVARFFPRFEREQELLAAYQAENVQAAERDPGAAPATVSPA